MVRKGDLCRCSLPRLKHVHSAAPLRDSARNWSTTAIFRRNRQISPRRPGLAGARPGRHVRRLRHESIDRQMTYNRIFSLQPALRAVVRAGGDLHDSIANCKH